VSDGSCEWAVDTTFTHSAQEIIMKLKGKVAVITGGSSGIGLATAEMFVDEGAYVFIVGRRQSELDKAQALIGRNVGTIQADVTDIHDLERVFEQVRAEKGIVNIVVTSAGTTQAVPLSDVTPEHFDAIFDLNTRASLFTAQKALPLMTEGGSIVLVSSGLHEMGVTGHSVYSASKAALRSFARTWAVELKDRGIRVNTLSAGPTETPLLNAQGNTAEEKAAIKAMFASVVPLGRIARPQEPAAAILFLASDDSSYTTGADLAADGGASQV